MIIIYYKKNISFYIEKYKKSHLFFKEFLRGGGNLFLTLDFFHKTFFFYEKNYIEMKIFIFNF